LVDDSDGSVTPFVDGEGNVTVVPVTIELQLFNGTVYETVETFTTAEDRTFSFIGLAAGTYRLLETVPEGFRVGSEGVGLVNGIQDGAAGDDTSGTIIGSATL